MRSTVVLLPLLLPALCSASPFEGSWNSNFDSAELQYSPETFEVVDGQYRCSTCVPTLDVAADGVEQGVDGGGRFDAIAVSSYMKE